MQIVQVTPALRICELLRDTSGQITSNVGFGGYLKPRVKKRRHLDDERLSQTSWKHREDIFPQDVLLNCIPLLWFEITNLHNLRKLRFSSHCREGTFGPRTKLRLSLKPVFKLLTLNQSQISFANDYGLSQSEG